MEESFFQRWARRKAVTADAPAQADGEDPGKDAPSSSSLPTLPDVALLNAESDYSLFVAKGVDQSVRRAALKKLFSDPHFNAMDGLDIYIGDYTKASPLSAGMLAAMQHARNMFAATPAGNRTSDSDSHSDSDPAADSAPEPGQQAGFSEAGENIQPQTQDQTQDDTPGADEPAVSELRVLSPRSP